MVRWWILLDRLHGMVRVPDSFTEEAAIIHCRGTHCDRVRRMADWRHPGKVRQLKLGRDGERCVGQFLERLRNGGGHVFHDIPGEDFNLDHVVISPQGLYVVETKTVSKPSPQAKITVESA